MRKWLIVASIVLGLGCWAFAHTAVGTGDPASASLNDVVTVSWSVLNWIILYIPAGDTSVPLGQIGPGLYHPDTGSWDQLKSGEHEVYVITNDLGGFQLQVSATLVSCPDGHPNPDGILARLEWSSSTLGGSGSLNGTVTCFGSRGLTSASDITYTFTPSFDDVAGDYSVTVTYTVTTQ